MYVNLFLLFVNKKKIMLTFRHSSPSFDIITTFNQYSYFFFNYLLYNTCITTYVTTYITKFNN